MQIKYELELNTKCQTGKAVAWEINNYIIKSYFSSILNMSYGELGTMAR